jgi:hypothetical protein
MVHISFQKFKITEKKKTENELDHCMFISDNHTNFLMYYKIIATT